MDTISNAIFLVGVVVTVAGTLRGTGASPGPSLVCCVVSSNFTEVSRHDQGAHYEKMTFCTFVGRSCGRPHVGVVCSRGWS